MEWELLLIAASTSTALHRSFEPNNLLDKLSRLEDAIKTGKIRTPKMTGIDTRAKSYMLGIIALLVPGIIAYFIARAIDPSSEAALKFSIGVTILSELFLTYRLDQFHVAIEKVTKAAKR